MAAEQFKNAGDAIGLKIPKSLRPTRAQGQVEPPFVNGLLLYSEEKS
jgi:hypothetical protein